MLPHSAPLPIAATIEAATGDVEVEFDRDLQAGPVDHLNWHLIANIGAGNNIQTPQPGAQTIGPFVRFATIEAGLGFPPFGITYLPPPFDVRSLPDVPAAAFADFAIAVI